jgi:hypothetical protein
MGSSLDLNGPVPICQIYSALRRARSKALVKSAAVGALSAGVQAPRKEQSAIVLHIKHCPSGYAMRSCYGCRRLTFINKFYRWKAVAHLHLSALQFHPPSSGFPMHTFV